MLRGNLAQAFHLDAKYVTFLVRKGFVNAGETNLADALQAWSNKQCETWNAQENERHEEAVRKKEMTKANAKAEIDTDSAAANVLVSFGVQQTAIDESSSYFDEDEDKLPMTVVSRVLRTASGFNIVFLITSSTVIDIPTGQQAQGADFVIDADALFMSKRKYSKQLTEFIKFLNFQKFNRFLKKEGKPPQSVRTCYKVSYVSQYLQSQHRVH